MNDLSVYKELHHYDNKRSLVLNQMTGDVCVMKKLSHYDDDVYAYLRANRNNHIPIIYDYHKDDKGYFVNLLWNNLDGNNGSFMETKVIKNGSYVHKKIELEPLDPIEVLEMNYPNFTFVNEKLYSVHNNNDDGKKEEL